MNNPLDQAVGFQFAKCLDKHSLRDTADGSFEFAESEPAIKQVIKDDPFPLATDQL